MIALALSVTVAFPVEQMAASVRSAMPAVCRSVRVAKYALQAIDSLNTYRLVGQGRIEVDPVSRLYGKRNPLAGFLGALTIDIATDLVTRHRPLSRCAFDSRQALISAEALRFTQTNGKAGVP